MEDYWLLEQFEDFSFWASHVLGEVLLLEKTSYCKIYWLGAQLKFYFLLSQSYKVIVKVIVALKRWGQILIWHTYLPLCQG